MAATGRPVPSPPPRPVPSRAAEPLSPLGPPPRPPSGRVSYPLPSPAPSTSERGAGTGTAKRLLPARPPPGGLRRARRGQRQHGSPRRPGAPPCEEPAPRGQLPSAEAAPRPSEGLRAAAPRPPRPPRGSSEPLRAPWQRRAARRLGALTCEGSGAVVPALPQRRRSYCSLPKEGTAFFAGLVRSRLSEALSAPRPAPRGRA